MHGANCALEPCAWQGRAGGGGGRVRVCADPSSLHECVSRAARRARTQFPLPLCNIFFRAQGAWVCPKRAALHPVGGATTRDT